MTIVTSSRKPQPEVRKLAKEVAFALDFPYVQRGKSGLRDFGEDDPNIIFISGSKRKGPIFDLTVNGEIVFSMLITNITVSERTAEFHKGFVTREEELYERLKPYLPITFDASVEGPICFCGTQKMRYVFQVMV